MPSAEPTHSAPAGPSGPAAASPSPGSPGSPGLSPGGAAALFPVLERYYDTVPRLVARAEDFGPLTLFVRDPLLGKEDWRFYARPTYGWTGRAANEEDVRRVRARQRELRVPESFEWVDESTPGLRSAVEATGLEVREHPLMVLDPAAPVPGPQPRARLLGPDDPALPAALAVPHLGFGHPGTDRGPEGLASLREWLAGHPDGPGAEGAAARIRAGGKAVAVAGEEEGLPLCSGQFNVVEDTAEVVAVATLPQGRRAGLARAVTSVLVTEARARGLRHVFLSADDEAVARVYARTGFRPVATSLEAGTPR
ncbi:GNAT family N-acetyltransferase [Streptomyces sp. NPDC007088]|uniref:GNAT family N-acetyltransferase n=1 Tax=Streptomyces sp. NPDC007088 TaxID=3364773 RepID=UPI003684CB26